MFLLCPSGSYSGVTASSPALFERSRPYPRHPLLCSRSYAGASEPSPERRPEDLLSLSSRMLAGTAISLVSGCMLRPSVDLLYTSCRPSIIRPLHRGCAEDAARKPRVGLRLLAQASLHAEGRALPRRQAGVVPSESRAVLRESTGKTPCCKPAEVRRHQSQLWSSRLIVCSRQPSVVTRASADVPAMMRFAQLRPLSRPHAPEISESQPSAARSPERVRVSLTFVFTDLRGAFGVLTA